jgi:hypothetical protein
MILKPRETKKMLFVKICVKDKNYFPKNGGDCNSCSELHAILRIPQAILHAALYFEFAQICSQH